MNNIFTLLCVGSSSHPFPKMSRSLWNSGLIRKRVSSTTTWITRPRTKQIMFILAQWWKRRGLNAFWFSENSNAICDTERTFSLSEDSNWLNVMLWRCFLKSISCWYLSLRFESGWQQTCCLNNSREKRRGTDAARTCLLSRRICVHNWLSKQTRLKTAFIF